MARYIHPTVAAAREDPTPSSRMDLVLVLEEGSLHDVAAELENLDVVVLQTFETDMVLVDAPETELEEICSLAGVESISPDKEMEILA